MDLEPTAMNSFVKRMHNLPPELFQHIRDYVLTAQSIVVPIDQTYRPPAALQVSKATKWQYGPSFYNLSIFGCADLILLRKYLASLTNAHRRLMRCMRVIISRPTGDVDSWWRQRYEADAISIRGAIKFDVLYKIRGMLRYANASVGRGVIQFEYRPDPSDDIVEDSQLRTYVGLKIWEDSLDVDAELFGVTYR